MSDYRLLIQTIAAAVLFIFAALYLADKSSYAVGKKRAGAITSGRVLRVERHSARAAPEPMTLTKIVVEIAGGGAPRQFKLTTFASAEYAIGSYIPVAVNFSTGKCVLCNGE